MFMGQMKKQRQSVVISVMATLFTLITFISSSCTSSANTSVSHPPPHIWQIQQDQTYAQNAEGTFNIKFVSITSLEFRFFYALETDKKVNISIIAESILSEHSTLLNTTVQYLGQLGNFQIGVIHVNRFSSSGQTILLSIRSLESKKILWQLRPLKQLNQELHENTARYGLLTDQTQLPAVEWNGPLMKEQVVFFSTNVYNDSSSKKVYIFLRLDDPIKVDIITVDQYRSIVGSANFSP